VFTIGPFARLAGVSAKVLRSYDQAGLFRPIWTDSATGYRYYSPAQLPEVRRILALRDVGIGLTEIGRLIRDGGDLRVALDRRRTELESERREIERRLATLDIQVETGLGDPAHPDVVLRPIAAESVALLTLEEGAGDDVEAAFYALETLVRDQGRRAHRPPGAVIHPGGRVEIFVPISRAIQPTDRIVAGRLTACRAATLIQRGPYGGIVEARRTLERWIATTGLAAAGPLRIIYLQFGAEPELRLPRGYLVNRAADFVTELQMPVASTVSTPLRQRA
jgi:DNA-binding transcriptional MerR regulator